MLEPIFLSPVFKDYIWGGTKLKEVFKKPVENEACTAESWEVSTNENGSSMIKNGTYQKESLKDLFDDNTVREEIFGIKTIGLDKFPILIKYLDANNKLSVQVHPDDNYAIEKENSIGKTEMWYILECDENAQIICGIKEGVDKSTLQQAIKEGKITDMLQFVPVQKGDVIYIESGTIHALLGGTLVAEVQQNSDLTYRLYDWDRVDAAGKKRELHIEKALDVIDFMKKPEIVHTSERIEDTIQIADSAYFKTDKIVVKGEYTDTSNEDTFYAVNVVEGQGTIISHEKSYQLNKGDSLIIPAKLGEYKILGELELLKSYI